MLIDSEARMLYLYGGRVVDGDWDSVKYAGLYSYDISSRIWGVIQ
jgi:muskelin